MKHNVPLQPALIFKCLLICYQTACVCQWIFKWKLFWYGPIIFLSDLNFQDWAKLLLSSVSITPENLEIPVYFCVGFLFNLQAY